MRSTFNRYFRICVVVAVLPVLMFVLSLVLRSATGPFWQYADPAYIYLLNSVNLVKGIPAAFYDQPGVPLQILGQVVILVLNCGHNAVDAVRSVLINPEFYLDAVNIVLLVLIPLTSIALGVYTYRKTHNFIAVFLSQLPNVFLLTLRTSHYHPVVYATVNAEPLLLCITNIFNLFLLKLFFAKTKKEEYCTVLILGFICGMGIATKLTVIMLLVLPLMVIRWRMKFFFLISLILSFIFWTLPILPVYSKLWAWVIELFTHTGVYGNGSSGIVDIHSYMAAWQFILQRYWFLIGFSLFALGIGTVQIIRKSTHPASFFMGAIALSILVQFFLIAKHFDEHYLVVAINCFGPLFVLFYCYQLPKSLFEKILVGLAVGVLIIQCSLTTLSYASQLAEMTHEVVGFNDRIHARYPNSVFVGSYLESPIRNPEYALFMGNDSSAGETQELSKLYPNNYSFFTDTRDIAGSCTLGLYNFKQSIWADDLLARYPSVIFINSGYEFSDSPYGVQLLEEGKYSKAYLLVSSTEKKANLFFNAALQSIQSGNYAQAFALALQSRYLHYQPKGKLDYLLSILYDHLKRKI